MAGSLSNQGNFWIERPKILTKARFYGNYSCSVIGAERHRKRKTMKNESVDFSRFYSAQENKIREWLSHDKHQFLILTGVRRAPRTILGKVIHSKESYVHELPVYAPKTLDSDTYSKQDSLLAAYTRIGNSKHFSLVSLSVILEEGLQKRIPSFIRLLHYSLDTRNDTRVVVVIPSPLESAKDIVRSFTPFPYHDATVLDFPPLTEEEVSALLAERKCNVAAPSVLKLTGGSPELIERLVRLCDDCKKSARTIEASELLQFGTMQDGIFRSEFENFQRIFNGSRLPTAEIIKLLDGNVVTLHHTVAAYLAGFGLITHDADYRATWAPKVPVYAKYFEEIIRARGESQALQKAKKMVAPK